MRDVALKYLAKGFSVVPVENKIAKVKWRDYQDKLPKISEVMKWWTDYPNADVAIITGRASGVSVVDVDVKSGGLTSLRALNLPLTWTVKTGGGGWHYYYKYSPNAPMGAGFYKGIDVRSDGGYVVAPPSSHKSGGKYRWTYVEGEMVDFPDDLFVKKEQNNWKEMIKGSSNGTRNETATKICGKLMGIFHPKDWEECVWSQLLAWNMQNKPPMEEKEVRSVYESIAKKAVNDVRKTDDESVDQASFHTFSEVLQKGYDEIIQTKSEDVISYGYEWLDYRLTGIFPGELTVIGGESGSGKTTFATNIIYKASKQVKCGVYALEDRLEDYGIKALYFKVNQIRDRLPYPWNDYRKNKIKDPKFLELMQEAKTELGNENIVFANVKKQMNIEILEKLIEKQAEQGIKLFLIDHLHYFDLNRGKDSKADHIEKIMVRLKTLLNRLGVSMLLVVHYRKLNGQKPTLDSFKDSISIVQNSNYVINLWRDRSGGAAQNETLFLIPKARNPNGEGTARVKFDPDINDCSQMDEWEFGTEQVNQIIKPTSLDNIKF